jgi:hypothetical protein
MQARTLARVLPGLTFIELLSAVIPRPRIAKAGVRFKHEVEESRRRAQELIAADSQDAGAIAARERLQAVLDQLNPAAGKTVPPDATKKKARKRKKNQ